MRRSLRRPRRQRDLAHVHAAELLRAVDLRRRRVARGDGRRRVLRRHAADEAISRDNPRGHRAIRRRRLPRPLRVRDVCRSPRRALPPPAKRDDLRRPPPGTHPHRHRVPPLPHGHGPDPRLAPARLATAPNRRRRRRLLQQPQNGLLRIGRLRRHPQLRPLHAQQTRRRRLRHVRRRHRVGHTLAPLVLGRRAHTLLGLHRRRTRR
mmetsp:Transcript_23530/g.72383  ORF Transcript_23530/g.72383 Transcript_23530/m.72383 type:complete len:207 (+) Transcript_23530:883-1503(+)